MVYLRCYTVIINIQGTRSYIYPVFNMNKGHSSPYYWYVTNFNILNSL